MSKLQVIVEKDYNGRYSITTADPITEHVRMQEIL